MPKITSVKLRATINIPHPTTIFGITINGIQPLFLIREKLHVLDRNLLTKIRSPKKSDADKYWIEQLNSPSVTINPIFAAAEGKSKRTPTQEEFLNEYFAAEEQIKQHLPSALLTPHTPETVSASYALVEDLKNRRDRETEFLLRAVPLVAIRHADKELRKKEDQIIQLAYDYSLSGGSLSLLATLSCLYESNSGIPASTGRGVLHPKTNYTAEMAHNSLSDLLALELLLIGYSLGVGNIAFISGDKKLGRFWQSLGASAGDPIDGKGRGNFQISTNLLNRIDSHGLERLKNIFTS